MLLRVFNYNTMEKVHTLEAHSDYIRCIVVHPTLPYILTSSGKCFSDNNVRVFLQVTFWPLLFILL